jgi:hypothetical protein
MSLRVDYVSDVPSGIAQLDQDGSERGRLRVKKVGKRLDGMSEESRKADLLNVWKDAKIQWGLIVPTRK